jgi:hypothetical protein
MKLQDAVAVPSSPCPSCLKEQDGVSGTTAKEPRPGDISVCIHCAEPALFDQQLLKVKWPEGRAISDEVKYVQRVIRNMHSGRVS